MGSVSPPQRKVSVLFVCLGNICRSTMAEGVFRSIVQDPSSPYYNRVGTVDSCGTGAYHTGDEPDSRTLSTLEDHGITDYTHEARRLRDSDFDTFDYIFAMDRSNLSDITRWRGSPRSNNSNRRRNNNDASSTRVDGGDAPERARVMLFGEFSGTGKTEIVQDPYYGGRDGFEKAYEQARRFSANFLAVTFPDVPAPATR